jgi:hypothetical protein
MPKLPVAAFDKKLKYCSVIDSFRLKDSLTFSANCGLSSGEINFWTGSPGDILTRIKIKLINKKSTTRELTNLLINTPAVPLFIKALE